MNRLRATSGSVGASAGSWLIEPDRKPLVHRGLTSQGGCVLIRRERPDDMPAVREVTATAFGGSRSELPAEVYLLDELRRCGAWLPRLSLVAVQGADVVIGHVVCTRADVGGVPVLGLGPLSVHPDHQRRGVGLALVHTALGAADAVGEPLVGLLGNPAYYGRFGFRAGLEHAIMAPDPSWGAAFQVRTLSGYEPTMRGAFRYAAPFDAV